MKRVKINVSPQYEVIVGSGVTERLTEELSHVFSGKACCVVSDNNVSDLYSKETGVLLKNGGYSPALFSFPAGESSKTMQTLTAALDHFAASGLTGTDFILALGGGIPGDVAGFAASCYKRGIGFAVLPTTLLSMVDSSVGGKTGVNLPAGKNLAGSFYQPSLVVCDTDRLATLPEREFKTGMAEIIKYGILRDRELFAMVADGSLTSGFTSQNAREKPDPAVLEEIITRCIAHKAHYVEQDERDRSQRRKLNLGHTVGHAVELAGSFSHTHGEAVSIGLAVISRAAERIGVAEKGTAQVIIDALKANGLPVTTDIPAERLLDAISQDKKRGDDSIDLILPVIVGKCVIRPVKFDELPELLRLGEEQ